MLKPRFRPLITWEITPLDHLWSRIKDSITTSQHIPHHTFRKDLPQTNYFNKVLEAWNGFGMPVCVALPWQDPGLQGLCDSGFSPVHWSPIRHVTERRATPSPQVTEHWEMDEKERRWSKQTYIYWNGMFCQWLNISNMSRFRWHYTKVLKRQRWFKCKQREK